MADYGCSDDLEQRLAPDKLSGEPYRSLLITLEQEFGRVAKKNVCLWELPLLPPQPLEAYGKKQVGVAKGVGKGGGKGFSVGQGIQCVRLYGLGCVAWGSKDMWLSCSFLSRAKAACVSIMCLCCTRRRLMVGFLMRYNYYYFVFRCIPHIVVKPFNRSKDVQMMHRLTAYGR